MVINLCSPILEFHEYASQKVRKYTSKQGQGIEELGVLVESLSPTPSKKDFNVTHSLGITEPIDQCLDPIVADALFLVSSRDRDIFWCML